MTTATRKLITSSPWGAVDTCYDLGDECFWVSTPSHGGLKLDRKHNAKMPAYMRQSGGWYEEDCDWCLPVLVFPAIADRMAAAFGNDDPAKIRTSAADTAINWHPHQYAAFYSVDVATLAGSSYQYDKELNEAKNADKWRVLAAWGDWHYKVPKGFVGVVASIGGSRAPGVERRHFLVSGDDYPNDKFGHVITDEQSWCGP